MKIFDYRLSEADKSLMRAIIIGVITILTLITAALSSFMLTDAGTKEHNWWVFLMVISWLAVGGSAIATGVAVKGYIDIRRGPAAAIEQLIK